MTTKGNEFHVPDLNPTPLYFQVPEKVLDEVLRGHRHAISPNFLCFETFYQAVAATWPKDFTVIDIGGAYGTQGWLFRDFERYVCVDSYELKPKDESVGGRCELPSNGSHVVADGSIYLSSYRYFEVDQSHDLFLCSAVSDVIVRDMVLGMPNSVVWYPGEPMQANGMHAATTIVEFDRLREEKWHDRADAAVWNAVDMRR